MAGRFRLSASERQAKVPASGSKRSKSAASGPTFRKDPDQVDFEDTIAHPDRGILPVGPEGGFNFAQLIGGDPDRKRHLAGAMAPYVEHHNNSVLTITTQITRIAYSCLTA